MARPTDEQIKLMRDAFLESYVRRNPRAEPAPGTSLYAVLEAAAGPLAAIMAAVGKPAEDAVVEFLTEDRQDVIQPESDETAYTRLEEVDEEGEATGEIEPRRASLKESDQWPCINNSEGSF